MPHILFGYLVLRVDVKTTISYLFGMKKTRADYHSMLLHFQTSAKYKGPAVMFALFVTKERKLQD